MKVPGLSWIVRTDRIKILMVKHISVNFETYGDVLQVFRKKNQTTIMAESMESTGTPTLTASRTEHLRTLKWMGSTSKTSVNGKIPTGATCLMWVCLRLRWHLYHFYLLTALFSLVSIQWKHDTVTSSLYCCVLFQESCSRRDGRGGRNRYKKVSSTHDHLTCVRPLFPLFTKKETKLHMHRFFTCFSWYNLLLF